jgi:hypothetical protein
MADPPNVNKKSADGRTVRFKTREMTADRIAAKIEKILKDGKDFRKPRTRKKKESVVRFLDNCGRPIPGRRRRQNGQRQRLETRKGHSLETCHGKVHYSYVY